jgi:hypothetical protein
MIHRTLPVTTRLAGAAAALVAALTLTACGSGSATATAGGAARSAEAAGSAGSVGPGAGASAAGVPGAGTSGRGTTGSGPATTGAPGGSGGGGACRNLLATSTVKQAVTLAHRAYSHLVHIQPEPGAFYYGACAGVQYAAVVFQAGPGAGHAEAVGLQDDGSAMQYYRAQTGAPWQNIASDSLPRDPRGCAAIGDLPAALSTLWAGCPLPGSGPAAPAAPAVPSLMSLGSPAQRPATAVLSGDSTVGLQGMSWTSWGTATATGAGTGWVEDCNPSCAAGTIHREPTRVTLTSPATACGVRYFQHAELWWTAAAPAGLPTRWALPLQQPICR